jgi:hypothetical protein
MLILIYFNYNQTISSRYSTIIIQNIDFKYCVWLNLGFYGFNTLLYWAYTQRYYHVYWVNTIHEIFHFLKTDSR